MGKTPITKLAQVALKFAVDSGKVIKPSNCEKCGKAPKNLHGHHEDYNKPLKVIWLCPACHSAEHSRISPLNTPTGNRFKKARMKLFASQQEAAKAMGLDQSTLSRWEMGERPVPDYVWIILSCVERERAEV